MSFKSTLSKAIANQAGRLQAQLTTQIQNRVLDLLNEFINQCPNIDRLLAIVKIKNKLVSAINGVQKKINSLRTTADRINNSVTAGKAAIAVIKRIPRPTVLQFVPDPGALVRGIPISTLTKLSDRLVQLNKIVDVLEAEKEGILGIITSADSTLTSVKNRLDVLNIAVEKCLKELPPDQAQGILGQIQPVENTGSEEGLGDEYFYKGYKLEIVQDPDSPAIAPRRYAVAKDREGIIVLYGPPSFSSDTQILLDEIKFRIDNQLP
jgi:hypothetical protein